MRVVRCRLGQAFCLCVFGGLLALPPEAAAQTPLSRWVFDSAVPAIEDLFKRHPRYSDSALEIRGIGDSALDAALASALRRGLGHRGVELRQAVAPTDNRAGARSIDALRCDPEPAAGHRLLVSVREDGSLAGVSLSLVDTSEVTTELRNWQWRGRLTADERDSLRKPGTASRGRGTLSAPWPEGEAEAVAETLSLQLACALRPSVAGQLRLTWAEAGTSGFYPTWLESRRRIGSFTEFANVNGAGDYRVAMQTEEVEPGVWQLWLDGTPARDGLPAVQAVTYARGDAASPAPIRSRTPVVRGPVRQPQAGEPASKYLRVDLLDAEQDDILPGRAKLRVRLRLSNDANRPLRYGLSLSGGHFRYCIAERDYYRHDRYGYLEGELRAGESTVRVMTIDGARHNPRPWFGMSRCAGFRDLDGFERFASQGHKVTQFIHWGQ